MPAALPAPRRAVLADAKEIARLAAQLGYPSSTDEMSARLARLLPRPEHLVAVMEVDSRLRGWIAVERRLLLEYGDKVEVVGLVVDVEARRSGVGKALIEAAEAWVRKLGLDAVMVRSNAARVESHPFYEGIGYVRRKTSHVYFKTLD